MSSVKLSDLRAEAIFELERLELEQYGLWDEMEKAVLLAGNNVIGTRLSQLEEEKHASGYPLWASILFVTALSVVPVGALAAWGFTKLVARGRYVLGRMGIDKRSGIFIKTLKATVPPLSKSSKIIRPDAKTLSLQLLETDRATLKVISTLGDEYVSRMRSVSSMILHAGAESTYEPAAKSTANKLKIVPKQRTDSSIVNVQEPLFDWMRNRKLVEGLAIARLKLFFKKDVTLTVEKIETEIELLKSVYNISGKEKYRNFFKSHVEACIWATTFTFGAITRDKPLDPKDTFPFFRVEKGALLLPAPYSKEFWSELTGRLIEDPIKGHTYQDRGVTDSNAMGVYPSSPALRLSIDLGRLAGTLFKKNMAIANVILKTKKQN